MLKKFTIVILFCFSLFLNIAYASGDIHIVYADDMPSNITGTRGAVTRYNKDKARLGSISAEYHDNGTKVNVRKLLGVNLLLLDISMPLGEINGVRVPGDGYSTLQRLQAEALQEGIILPPCIAVTTEDDYLNKDGATPTYATDRGFLFARDKILPGAGGFPSIFKKCEDFLGNDWLTMRCGRRSYAHDWKENSSAFSVSASASLRISHLRPCEKILKRENGWKAKLPGFSHSDTTPSRSMVNPFHNIHPFMIPEHVSGSAKVPSPMRSPAPRVPKHVLSSRSVSSELEEIPGTDVVVQPPLEGIEANPTENSVPASRWEECLRRLCACA